MTMSMTQEGLPSEQTADRFASLFPYHALPVLASCGLASIKAHREYLAGAPLALSPSGGWAMTGAETKQISNIFLKNQS